jgi:hypothetical protein
MREQAVALHVSDNHLNVSQLQQGDGFAVGTKAALHGGVHNAST